MANPNPTPWFRVWSSNSDLPPVSFHCLFIGTLSSTTKIRRAPGQIQLPLLEGGGERGRERQRVGDRQQLLPSDLQDSAVDQSKDLFCKARD